MRTGKNFKLVETKHTSQKQNANLNTQLKYQWTFKTIMLTANKACAVAR